MNIDHTSVNLRAEEVVELSEMLEFLCDWLNDSRLATSYHQFTFGLLTVDELRADLARFAFLLGGGGHLLNKETRRAVSGDPRTPRQAPRSMVR